MIQVLVVDDNPHKLKTIRTLLEGIQGVRKYEVAQDATMARLLLEKNFYDLVILDLNIPLRFGDDPIAANSIKLLTELNRGQRLVKPSSIIGLTEFEDLKQSYSNDFENHLLLIILYELSSDSWEIKLKLKIDYLIKSKNTLLLSNTDSNPIDLVFICALRTPELDAVLRLPINWESFKLPNDPSEYHKGYYKKDERQYSIVAAYSPQMGMTACSVLTMKIIHSFRPKYIAMTGIAAGISGKGNYGDIMVAQLSFDYNSGKNKKNGTAGIFEPDYKPIELSRDLNEDIISCIGRRDFLEEIKRQWAGDNRPNTDLNVYIGPVGSGAAVIGDETILSGIQQHTRKLIGIDMETYGLYYAANNCSKPKPIAVISIKSISDFANQEKNDSYQNYASYTSAQYAFRFFTEIVFKMSPS